MQASKYSRTETLVVIQTLCSSRTAMLFKQSIYFIYNRA